MELPTNCRLHGSIKRRLPGDTNTDTLQGQLDIMSDIILGDFNAHHAAWGETTNNRGNVVHDTFEEDFDQLIPANTITFRRGSITSCLDLIFVKKGLQATTHTLSCSWLGSDHALIAITIQMRGTSSEMSSRIYTTPDWTKWNKYIDANPLYTPTHHGDAYNHLCEVARKLCKQKEATPRSKKWWDEELNVQLKRTKMAGRKGEGYEKARDDLHRMIKRKKKEGWGKFLEEHGHKDPWEVVRIAKDPFKCSPLMGDIMTEDGRILTTDQEKVREGQTRGRHTNQPWAALPGLNRWQQQRVSGRQPRQGGRTCDRNQGTDPTDAYGTDTPYQPTPGCAPTGPRLHFVRKVDSPACPNCDHPSEDGHHITFDCPHHRQQRQELIGDARTWEDLDKPIWRKEEGEEEEWDAVEAYFAYLYRPLAGR
ncbi:hypothetical protein EV426DRAFT_681503 [Tirmania nivea]|nr:hypothetical protein EV426DRAFT_681503 [Tirmania nivea]